MSASNLTTRTYVASRFAIDLGGTPGFLKSLEGGNVKSAVMTEGVSAHNTVFKSIGIPEIEDVSFQIGLSSSPPLNDWIQRSSANNYQRQDGALYTADFNYEIKSHREFKEALITEVGFPACDSSSKDAGYMSVKFRPESITTKPVTREKLRGIFSEHQKLWLPANFRLTIDGLEKALKHCNKVEAMTVKQTVVKLESGNARIYELEPGKLEFPNLVFTVPEAYAEPIIKWHQSFVIDGTNSNSDEKTGSLTFLSPNLKDSLGEIKFTGIGIFNVSADKGEAGNESIRRVKVECYVEDFKFTPSTSFTKRF